VAISAGDAVWTIGADTKPLDKGLDSADARVNKTGANMAANTKKIGAAMTAMGAAVVGGIGVMVKGFADAGDEVQKMSLRTGFSTESLSKLRHAAELSGATLTGLETGFKKMARTVFEASEGVDTYVDALDAVGLTAEELEGLNQEEQFNKIAFALADVEDAGKRAALAQEIFGRAGTQMLPMLAQGEEGLRAMFEEAERLGIVFDQDAADAAARFNDEVLALQESFRGLFKELAEALIPVLNDMIPRIKEVVISVKDWVTAHPELTGTILKVVAAVGALMLALGPILIVLPGIVSAFGLLSGAAGVAAGAAGVGAATTALGAFAAAAAPVVLAGAAIVGAFSIVATGVAALTEKRRAALAEEKAIQAEQDFLLKLGVSNEEEALAKRIELQEQSLQGRRDVLAATKAEMESATGDQLAILEDRANQEADLVSGALLRLNLLREQAGLDEVAQAEATSAAVLGVAESRISGEEAAAEESAAIRETSFEEAANEINAAFEAQKEATKEGQEGINETLESAAEGMVDPYKEAMAEYIESTDNMANRTLTQAQQWEREMIALANSVRSSFADLPTGGGGGGGDNPPGFASGGIVPGRAGGFREVTVGELGPERVILPSGSRIFSAAETQAMGSGLGGITNNFNGPITVRSESDLQAIGQSLGEDISRRLRAKGVN
jgi:TP901 family phage tail tape measure protein